MHDMRKLMEMVRDDLTGDLLADLKAIVAKHNNNQGWAEDGYYDLLDELERLIKNADRISDNNHDVPMMLRKQAE